MNAGAFSKSWHKSSNPWNIIILGDKVIHYKGIFIWLFSFIQSVKKAKLTWSNQFHAVHLYFKKSSDESPSEKTVSAAFVRQVRACLVWAIMFTALYAPSTRRREITIWLKHSEYSNQYVGYTHVGWILATYEDKSNTVVSSWRVSKTQWIPWHCTCISPSRGRQIELGVPQKHLQAIHTSHRYN